MVASHRHPERKMGPKLPFSEELHSQKYRSQGETFRDAMNRIASALKDSDAHWAEFRDIIMDMRFLPAGRIQSAMGSTKNVTPYNCYVSGTISDSFVEGEGNIMQRAAEAAATMRMGGGIGYDFSTLRPRGATIKKLGSQSSGPVAFMQIYDAICRCVASSGHRRGAQMGVMRVDHPDIEEFIYAKQNEHALTGFNVSVAITDEFMECVEQGAPFDLRFNGEVYKTVDAQQLWETIMRSTWDWAEPGVIFIDTVNRRNNLAYCETIAATNPCGEQPLPPHGACLLGSFNLVKYVTQSDLGFGFDYSQLAQDVKPVVRAMDNVIDRATYPLRNQQVEAITKRRMGLGVTGLANAAEALGHPYGSTEFLAFQERVLSTIACASYEASIQLSQEKGAFPLFDPERYGSFGSFVRSTLPTELQKDIRRYGIRNSHLTSIAPTGTISLAADNVSSGIEPVFAYSFDRTVIEFNGPRTETIHDYGFREWGVRGRTSAQVQPLEHVSVLATAQRFVDSAVSKTCNVPADASWEEFKQLYRVAWKSGAKGCTTFRNGGKRAGVLVVKEEDTQSEPATACFIDPETGRRECA